MRKLFAIVLFSLFLLDTLEAQDVQYSQFYSATSCPTCGDTFYLRIGQSKNCRIPAAGTCTWWYSSIQESTTNRTKFIKSFSSCHTASCCYLTSVVFYRSLFQTLIKKLHAFTGLFTKNVVTPFSLFFMYLTHLFYMIGLKVYPIRLSFIYSAYLNFNPGGHPNAPMTTTCKGPNMPPSKFHNSLWRPSILPKRL